MPAEPSGYDRAAASLILAKVASARIMETAARADLVAVMAPLRPFDVARSTGKGGMGDLVRGPHVPTAFREQPRVSTRGTRGCLPGFR
jgi:hypothetical protein